MRQRTRQASPTASRSRPSARATSQRRTPMAVPTSISAPTPLTASKATGSPPCQARAISRFCGSTARPKQRSTKAGNPEISRRCSDEKRQHIQEVAMLKPILFSGIAVLAVLVACALTHAQSIDTRIGKLELQNGYPSKATVEKLYDE